MKNILLSTLISVSFFSFSQNPDGWIEEAAQWYYGGGLFGASYYLHATYAGVENIDGIPFQKVNALEQWLYPQPDGSTSLGSIFNHNPRYYYTSNDSVFLRKQNGSLQFVWHLNPQVGDVWDFGIQTDFQEENPLNAYAVVTEVEPISIAGVQTLKIKTTPCIDALGTLPTEQDTFYYDIFLNEFNALFGPTDYLKTGIFVYSHEMTIIEFAPLILNCYLSSNTPLYQANSNSNCYNNVILANEENEILETTIYPNPASSSFTTTNPEYIKSIRIYDLQGRLQDQNTALPMDIVHLSAGVYWVHLEALDGKTSVEKLVIE